MRKKKRKEKKNSSYKTLREKILFIVSYLKEKIYRTIKYSKIYILFSVFGCVVLITVLCLLYQNFRNSSEIMKNFPGIIISLSTALIGSLFFITTKELIGLSKEKDDHKIQFKSFYKLRNCDTQKDAIEIVEEKFKKIFI